MSAMPLLPWVFRTKERRVRGLSGQSMLDDERAAVLLIERAIQQTALLACPDECSRTNRTPNFVVR